MRRITEVPRWQQPETRKIRLDGLPNQPYDLEAAPVPGSELIELHFLLHPVIAGNEEEGNDTAVSTAYLLRHELAALKEYLEAEPGGDFVSESGIRFRTYNGLVGEGDQKEVRRQVSISMKDLDGEKTKVSHFSADGLSIVIEPLIPSEEPEPET